jgi:hypothetical protein
MVLDTTGDRRVGIVQIEGAEASPVQSVLQKQGKKKLLGYFDVLNCGPVELSDGLPEKQVEGAPYQGMATAMRKGGQNTTISAEVL